MTVTDNGLPANLNDTQTIAVTVTNVNENPVITSNGGGASASVNVQENSTAVTTVTATDVDAGQTQTYSITGGADSAKFSIGSSSGVLAFLVAPDFETPTDSGGNNVYDVTVTVTDNGAGNLTDTQAIAVTVTDVVSEGPVCTPAAMSISVAPATQNVRPGFAITYNITVVNNDSAECSNLTVSLGVGDNPTTPTANFAVSTLSVPSIVVAPQNSGGATLTVTAQGAGAELSQLTTTVTATAGGHAAQNDSVVSTILDYNPLIHSSKSTNSSKWGVNGWGIAGGQYGEITCATCHTSGESTPNIKRIRAALSATFGSRAVSLTTTNEVANPTGNGFGDDSDARGATNSNRICEVCHTITSFHRVTTSSTPDLTHQNNTDCITCHQHSKGFDASCTTCHGNPPVDSGTLVQPSSRPTGSLTAGAHGAHNTLGFACARCHYNSVGTGATHDVNGQVSLGFVNLPTGTGGSTGGVYNGQTTVTYNSTYAGTTVSSSGNKTCTNYCHGSTIGGTGAVWDNPSSGTCGNCHGATNPSPPTRVNHPRHAGTGAGELGLTCDKCHGASYAGGTAPANHMNGSVTYDVSGLTGATPTYRGNSGAQSTGALAPSGTYGNCANVYCHSNVQSSNGTAAASGYATPTWGTASVACDSCHGQAGHTNGQPNSGSHEIHVTTRGYACSTCHSGAGDETTLHANGTINISISATYGATATYSQGSHAPGSGGYGTCSNVTCHNMKTTTVNWGTTPVPPNTCTLCHTVDGTNSATVANPVSGLHGNTVATVQDHDSTLAGGCEACHVKANITGHWNGAASATADYTAAQVGIGAMYTDASGTAATRGTCMGTSYLTSCHTDKGNWRRLWSTNADVDITTSKLPGQAVCNVCHGQYSTLANSTGWNEGTVHYRSGSGATENKGIIHTDVGDECEDCHGYDSAAVHNSNNKIDFSDLGNPSGYAVTLNTTPNPDVWYCAACHNTHNTQDATLTDTRTFLDSLAFPNGTNPINHVTGTSVPQGSCFGCHGDGVAEYWPQNAGNVRSSTATADYNNAGAHQKHIEVIAARLSITLPGDDTQQKTMCGYCHTVADGDHMTTGATGQLAEVFPGNAGKSLWGAADSSVSFVNTATYNCTTADCHNSKDTTATYSWYSAATSSCTMCHTVGGTNTATNAHPASGIHDVARITGHLHDDSFTYATNYASTANCVTCHTATPTTGTNAHINGTNDYSIGAADAVDPKVNMAATVGFTDAAVPTCAPTLGTGCHAEQWSAATDHTWTRDWHESAGNNDGTECRGCHGTFTQSWNGGVSPSHLTDYDGTDGAEIRLNHDHGATSETEYNQCISCHVYNDALYTGGLGWGNGVTGGNKHGNGQLEMIQDMAYNTTTNGCGTTCHTSGETGHYMTPDSGWTIANLDGPNLACTGCHSSIYNAGAGTHIDADGAGTTYPTVASPCEDCHTSHSGYRSGTNAANDIYISTIYGRTVVANNPDTGTLIPTMNAQYASHDSYIQLGGVATNDTASYSTEAEMCWGCHDNIGAKTRAASLAFTTSTITDAGNGFVTAGFAVGDYVTVTAGAAANLNKHGKITAVANGTLTFAANTWTAAGAAATTIKSPISEWGENTAGGATYDMGLLFTDASTLPGTRTSNWTTSGAAWRSAKGLNSTATSNPFWYKRGSIRSLHSANYDGTTATTDTAKTWKASLTNTAKPSGYSTTYNKNENRETVGNIRCTYCHDVHGTHNGVKGDPGGAPYLRGTWVTNPYPEDGAPRFDMSTFTNQLISGSTTIAFGVVPRASADPNNTGLSGVSKVGGFWIDQNSANPTGSITGADNLTKATNSSGLCEQCHGANKTGTWTAAAIGAIDQVTGESLWISGASGNGHANAVLGAAGVTTTAANIYTRTLRGAAALTGAALKTGKFSVDMGLASQTSYGTSYRQSTNETSGYRWKPWIANSTEAGTTAAQSYAYQAFAWNNTYQTGTRNFLFDANTAELAVAAAAPATVPPATESAHNSQANYHTFTCSKCHNPHASRLPKLMITNCLDTNHNTWEDKSTFTQGQTGSPAIGTPWSGLRHSQFPSAQNCHRLDARAVIDGTTTVGTGWNKATPWMEDSTPNTTITGDVTTYDNSY